MCGLAGLIAADPARPVLPGGEADVALMLSTLAHRGPDGERVVGLEGAVLGHRRLAVIDLTGRSAQPMPLRCGATAAQPPFWIALNGEIYNYLELRAGLVARGHVFSSDGDTEVALHLYEEEGETFVRHLRGMFAIAVWDARSRRAVLARDRMGQKPLYYTVAREGLRFASELKALTTLMRSRGEPVEPRPSALRSYLALKYVPGPATAVEGIMMLPAGSILVYERGRASIRSWWTLPDAAPDVPVDEAALGEELAATLDESVRLRLRSDVPLGLFLSGGLDSGIIATRMARLAPGRVKTFTIGFDRADYDETSSAALVARSVGADHHEIPLRPTAARTIDALPEIAWHMDQPFADSSAVAVYHLARAVREHVTVSLSGDGADELFLGYDRYRAHRMSGSLGARVAARVAGAIPVAASRRNLAGRARRFAEAASLDPRARNDAWIACLDPGAAAAVLSPDFLRAAGPGDPLAALHAAWAGAGGGGDPLLSAQRADLLVSLPDDMLHKVDAATMAHALEARSPFLDHRVVELAMRIPARLKIGARGTGRGKLVLRRVFGRDLPRAVTRGRKAGFGLPLDHWLRGELAGYCRDLLLDRGGRARGILRPEGVRALLDEHATGAANREDAIWALVMLEHWFRSVVEAAATPAAAGAGGPGR